ncbi:MAG: aminotransferase class V-fold PLP-dependent enzyme, partial [Pseudomonadota bacterium]|nr:aminotransferase class V-fold PLP-dependent enzyme [Pseudomonadota bacterium]
MKARTYLDHNSGAPLLASARAAMIDALALTGNASSVHGEGRARRKLVEEARATLAAALDVSPSRVVFTAGASEAANHALSPVLKVRGEVCAASRLYV